MYNFLKKPERTIPGLFWLLMMLLWLMIIKNIYSYFLLLSPPKPLLLKTPSPNFRMFEVIHAIANVKFKNCLIKKIEIYPHEILITGKGFHEKVISFLSKDFQKIQGTHHIEVKQWDYIKEGKWRFILGVQY
jgi:hypothetical protein